MGCRVFRYASLLELVYRILSRQNFVSDGHTTSALLWLMYMPILQKVSTLGGRQTKFVAEGMSVNLWSYSAAKGRLMLSVTL